jgi:hypothetical protein
VSSTPREELEARIRVRLARALEHLRHNFDAGFALPEAEGEALVTDTATEILAHVESELVPAKLRRAVLARDELVNRWPWPSDRQRPGSAVSALITISGTPPPGELAPFTWPPDVAPRDVAEWAGPVIGEKYPEVARQLMEMAARGLSFLNVPQWAALAVLYSAREAVERDRHRPAMALDAGQPHHELLMGWRDYPKGKSVERPVREGRIELLAPGKSVQLALDLGPDFSMSEDLVRAIRVLRDWEGLRNWAAIQRLLSVEGGRVGWVRWTLDGHLNALGITAKERWRPSVRRDVAQQVEAFTRLELVAYDQQGRIRERRPLLLAGAKFDRLRDSEWELDGMELQINPLLYSGVREDGGKLGSNWYPAPVALARVDHHRHRYTLALGLILPMRWRLALADTPPRDHVTLTGESALRLAGIPYQKHDPGKAWDALARDLEELRRIDGLGRWEWDAAGPARALAGRLHLWPALWVVDRTIHGVRPLELPPGPPILTGAELKAWRKGRNLTQAGAAEVLGVSPRTVMRAELAGAEGLSPLLADKLRQARM